MPERTPKGLPPSDRPPAGRAPGERVEPAEPPFEPQVAEELAKLTPPGRAPLRLFRILAKNPRLLQRVRAGNLLDQGSVALRHRELMILRTTALCGAEYEWGVHAMLFAEAAGLDEAQLRATVHEGTRAQAPFSDRDRAVLKLADELHADDVPSDKTFIILRALFEEPALLELVALAGQYRGISYLVNTARPALEPGAPRFPR